MVRKEYFTAYPDGLPANRFGWTVPPQEIPAQATPPAELTREQETALTDDDPTIDSWVMQQSDEVAADIRITLGPSIEQGLSLIVLGAEIDNHFRDLTE